MNTLPGSGEWGDNTIATLALFNDLRRHCDSMTLRFENFIRAKARKYSKDIVKSICICLSKKKKINK